ncbi:MAG: PAS domain-containing protein [Candidatus Marinimicrobia bacterium]|nr:PAS domain-containing protein [Candidatus Neomarinimicrobiota bacterium]
MDELKGDNIFLNIITDWMQPGCIIHDGKILYFNNEFADLCAYSEKEIPEIIFKGLFFQSDYSPADLVAMINKKSTEFLFLKRATGDYIPIIISMQPFKNEGSFIFLSVTDLMAVGASSYPELNYFNLFENNPLGIITFDPQFNILRTNETAKLMFGLKTDKVFLKDFVPLQNLELIEEKLHRCYHLDLSDELVVSCQNQKKDILYCKWFIVPNKKNQGLIAYINDITGMKTAEHNLYKEKSKVETINQKLKKAIKDARKLASEVSYANTSKANFIANISHEIRTPLNAIMGFSEILAKEIENSQHRIFLNSIIQSGRSLLEIINSILDYSKLEAGKRKVEKSEIQLHRFIENSIRVYREMCHQKKLAFNFTFDNALPQYVELDKNLLGQILRNLLDNAVKFTSEGSIHLSLSSLWKDEDFVDLKILVRDTGIGIPADQQEKIFFPFSQKDDQVHAQYGGTGLGLSIVQKSVSLLSGQLVLESKPGTGTTFTITLPHISIANKEESVEKIQLNSVGINRIHFQDNPLLIADKTDFTRHLIKNYLKDYAFKIFEAENKNEILEKLENIKPAVMVLNEVFLEDTTLKSQLKQVCEKNKTAVVLFGNKKTEKEYPFCNPDLFLYIEKPINQETLIKGMAGFLDFNIESKGIKPRDQGILPASMPKERIERMVHFLTQEYLPKCQNLQENLLLNQVEELCVEISDIAEQNTLWILINWTRELNSATENFEILKIKQLLGDFSNIIKEINLLLK